MIKTLINRIFGKEKTNNTSKEQVINHTKSQNLSTIEPSNSTANEISTRLSSEFNNSQNLTWGRAGYNEHVRDSETLKKSLSDMATVTHAGDGNFASVLLVSPVDDTPPIAAKIGMDEKYHAFVTEIVNEINNEEDGFPNQYLPRIYSTTSFTSPLGEGHIYCMEELQEIGEPDLPEDVRNDITKQFKNIIHISKVSEIGQRYSSPEALAQAVDELSLDATDALEKIIEYSQKNDTILDIGGSNIMLRVGEDKENAHLVITDPLWGGDDNVPDFSKSKDDEPTI
jgi:hypothetical protein